MALVPLNSLIYGPQPAGPAGPALVQRQAPMPMMPSPQMQQQREQAPSGGMGLLGGLGGASTGAQGGSFFEGLDRAMMDPLMQASLAMIANGSPQVGGPRPMFAGVPQALANGQMMQMRQGALDQERADREAAQNKENSTKSWLQNKYPDLAALYDTSPEDVTRAALEREQQAASLNDPNRKIAAENIRGYGHEDIATGLENGWMTLDDAWGEVVNRQGKGQANQFTDTQTNLSWRAEQAGLVPGTPEYRQFMASGGSGGGGGVTIGTDANGNPIVQVGGDGGRFGTTADGGFGNIYTDINSRALSAISGNDTLTAMEQAMSDPSFYSGFGNEQLTDLKRAAAAIGIDPEGVKSIETFNALSKQSALAVMGGSLGAGFSNADRDFVMDQVATLGNTPEGNRALLRLQRQMNDRAIDVAVMAEEYRRTYGKLDGGFTAQLAQWAEANPLFAGGGQQSGQQPGQQPNGGSTMSPLSTNPNDPMGIL